MNEKIGALLLGIKKVLWYYSTEPFKQTWDIIKHAGRVLEKTRVWIFITAGILLLACILGKSFYIALFLIMLLVIIMITEIQSGVINKRWKEKEKKRLEKKLLLEKQIKTEEAPIEEVKSNGKLE